MMLMITPAAATIGTTAESENALYTLLYTLYAVLLAEPVNAGIDACRLLETSNPIGIRTAQATRTTTMPITKPVIALLLEANFLISLRIIFIIPFTSIKVHHKYKFVYTYI